ncbi:MAG: glycosyltransferase family 2 protein [Candidatus Omnitrophota bacterium]|jgi:GT2 family glycosyltransferase
MPLVSIVVVTNGAREYWQACLEALARQTYNTIEVILVDNSLHSGLSLEVKSKYPHVAYYSETRNLFYASGLNKGISLSSGDFLLCMNDDVVLTPDFISRTVKGFETGSKVGMVSGKILRPGGTIIDSTGLSLSIFRTATERGYNTIDRGRFNKQGYIFGVGGAAAFYRRAALEDVKESDEYFDADFRMFYEDLDLAWRLQRKGWRCVYIPEAVAYHTRGASAREAKGLNKRFARRYLSDELHWDLVKNRYLAMAKNETLAGLLLHLPFIVLYDFFAWGLILFTRPKIFRNLPSLFRLVIDALLSRQPAPVIAGQLKGELKI